MKGNQKYKLRELRRDTRAQTAAAIMSVILLIVGFAVAGLLLCSLSGPDDNRTTLRQIYQHEVYKKW